MKDKSKEKKRSQGSSVINSWVYYFISTVLDGGHMAEKLEYIFSHTPIVMKLIFFSVRRDFYGSW